MYLNLNHHFSISQFVFLGSSSSGSASGLGWGLTSRFLVVCVECVMLRQLWWLRLACWCLISFRLTWTWSASFVLRLELLMELSLLMELLVLTVFVCSQPSQCSYIQQAEHHLLQPGLSENKHLCLRGRSFCWIPAPFHCLFVGWTLILYSPTWSYPVSDSNMELSPVSNSTEYSNWLFHYNSSSPSFLSCRALTSENAASPSWGSQKMSLTRSGLRFWCFYRSFAVSFWCGYSVSSSTILRRCTLLSLVNSLLFRPKADRSQFTFSPDRWLAGSHWQLDFTSHLSSRSWPVTHFWLRWSNRQCHPLPWHFWSSYMVILAWNFYSYSAWLLQSAAAAGSWRNCLATTTPKLVSISSVDWPMCQLWAHPLGSYSSRSFV